MENPKRDLTGIFSEAVLIEDHDQRKAYLESSCYGDEKFQREIEELLAAHETCHESFVRPFASVAPNTDKDDEEEPLPRAFGGYTLEEKLKQGGMGVVYIARQHKLERKVALKMIRNNAQLATRQDVQRFHAEARAAAELHHPGIVPVIEIGKVEGQHFFSMGYIEGMNLSQAVEKKLLSHDQKLDLLKQIATAVTYAHRKGVIHRDLKPENILISTKEGSRDDASHYSAHISDFGLAKRSDQDLELTLAGQIFGTPSYMSPEQAKADPDAVGEAADIYALGGLMYFLLSGCPPIKGTSVWDVIQQVKTGNINPLRTLEPSTPKSLDTICHKCLQLEPKDRYTTADELLKDLENYQSHRPLLARPTGNWTKLAKLFRRHPATALASILGLLVLASAIVLPLTLKKAANEKQITESTRLELLQQEAKSALNLGQAEIENRDHAKASLAYINAKKLTAKANDPKLSSVAQSNLNWLKQQEWKILKTLPTTDPIQQLMVSESGNHLAMISGRGHLKIIDLDTEDILLEETLPTPESTMAFHPNGNEFVAATGPKQLKIWKLQRDKYLPEGEMTLKRKGTKISPGISKILFSVDGLTFFTLTSNRQVLMWDYHRQKPSRLPLASSPMIDIQLSQHANIVVGFSQEGTISSWDASTGKPHFSQVSTGNGELHWGQVNPAGTKILIQFKKHKKRHLYDISHCNQKTKHLKEAELSLSSQTTFSSSSGKLLSLEQNNRMRFLKSESPPEESWPLQFTEKIGQTLMSPDEKSLLVTHPKSKNITVWKTPDVWGKELSIRDCQPENLKLFGEEADLFLTAGHTLQQNTAPVREPLWPRGKRVHLAGRTSHLLPDDKRGKLFIVTTDSPDHTNGALLRVDPVTLKTEWTSGPIDNEVLQMNQSPDGKTMALLAAGDGHPTLFRVDLESGAIHKTKIPIPAVKSFVFSAEVPQDIILLTPDGKLVWFRPEDEKIIRTKKDFTPSETLSIAASHATGLLLLGGSDGIARVYQENNFELISASGNNLMSLNTVSFASKGGIMVCGGDHPEVRLWDTATGLSIGSSLIHSNAVIGLEVHDPSHTLLVRLKGDKMCTWHIPQQVDLNSNINI